MIVDEELAGLEFLWIHAIKQHPFAIILLEIFCIELGSHRTPDLGTLERSGPSRTWAESADLYVGDMTLLCQIHPICLIEFGPDHVIEINDFVVLTNKSSGEPQFRVCLDGCDNLPEHCCGDHVDLVEQDESPLPTC
jgi:hypothetical protein